MFEAEKIVRGRPKLFQADPKYGRVGKISRELVEPAKTGPKSTKYIQKKVFNLAGPLERPGHNRNPPFLRRFFIDLGPVFGETPFRAKLCPRDRISVAEKIFKHFVKITYA